MTFNGAMAFQPWKRYEPTDVVVLTEVALQWGHGLSAMETPLIGTELEEEEETSMGPWPFSHGNLSHG